MASASDDWDVARPLLIERVTNRFSEKNYPLKGFSLATEVLENEGRREIVDFLQGWVPLDCIDDHSKASSYNPRKPRKPHRQRLMEEIGDYGLVQPLVVAMERTPEWDFIAAEEREPRTEVFKFTQEPEAGPFRLYLLDGRHRYQGLLHLFEDLREEVNEVHKKINAQLTDASVGHSGDFVEKATKNAIMRLLNYHPPTQRTEKGIHVPLVPVKVYLSPDEVRRIGLAVFLNKGQKRLSGGEEVLKIAAAYEQALREEYVKVVNEVVDIQSEKRAVDHVSGSSTASGDYVVLSWFAAVSMDPELESPWHELIAKYQGDDAEVEISDGQIIKTRRPLTAQNFVAFIRPLLDATPQQEYNEEQRQHERSNLDRLGALFRRQFNWPNSIPGRHQPFTATGQLCRSFLISALGGVLGKNLQEETTRTPFLSRKLSDPDKEEEIWDDLEARVRNLASNLSNQAERRAQYEEKKKEFKKARESDLDRTEVGRIVHEMDELRGTLWSMDTIKGSLTRFIEDALDYLPSEKQEEADG